MRFSSLGAHLPRPRPPPPPASRGITRASSPAQFGASCVGSSFVRFPLGMLGNSAKTKEIPSEFAGRAGTGQSTRAAGLDSNPFGQKTATLQVKRVSPELHLAGVAPPASGISVAFKLPGKPGFLLGRRTSLGVTGSRGSGSARFLRAGDRICEAFCEDLG